MNKKVLTIFILFLLATGVATLAVAQGREGNKVPVITQSFASQGIRPGDTWKVYLNASTSDGNMKAIFAAIDQPGVGTYPISITRIKEENQKELSGYIYLNTLVPARLEFVHLTLTVQIQDKTGNFSQPAVFPLAFNSRSAQEAPPQGMFKEQDLGSIMITLRNIDAGSEPIVE